MLAINNNNYYKYLHFQRQLLVEAWEFDDGYKDDIIDQITIPMMEIAIELGPSNTHTISGEIGIGIFTLIYYNLTTDSTTYTSTHTTTVKSTITSTTTDSTTVTSTKTGSTTLTSITTVSVTVSTCAAEGKLPTYTYMPFRVRIIVYYANQ